MKPSLLSLLLAAILLGVTEDHSMGEAPKSLDEVHEALKEKLSDDDASQIATYMKKRMGKSAKLKQGAHSLHLKEKGRDGAAIGWCFEADPSSKIEVVANNGQRWVLSPLGKTGLHAAVAQVPNYTAFDYYYLVDGKENRDAKRRVVIDYYELGPDSQEQSGVPKGEVIAMTPHTSKEVYPGAERDWWIYVPAQYDPEGPPAALMVFQDGGWYCHGEGNAAIAFDNLIHQKRMPVTIGVFVNPGIFPPKEKGGRTIRNRGNEYDTCTSQYAEFLEKEILPLVTAKYKITDDPKRRAICGASSGGSCAFTAAWHRPDMFGLVLSQIGSFCDFRPIDDYPHHREGENVIPLDEFGPWKTAHDYPAIIRKTHPRKPLRVFLQEGRNDLDNQLGNWFLANQQMAEALKFGGYDYKLVLGDGGHSRRHGNAIFPESLDWIWADWKASSTESGSSN
ncbi:Enterochelin esterase [Planctomycetes bacterium Pan216]|uniref:Enterochelin esterase n=1 Tax=Kolteria novifilia TaxID=2527975 RepID=A0A518B5U6_9BACT|nr:Enterochelin esterase [Planctomycetes bacterium Pan216]